MTGPDAPPAEPPEALAREAAQWFARLRGPDAPAAQAEFEAWLAQGPAHRKAYNRAAEIFTLGKLLADEDDSPAPVPARAQPRRRTFDLALSASIACLLAASIACLLAASAWVVLRATGPAGAPQITATGTQTSRALSTLAGETRTVRLADGSTATLGSDSAVTLRFEAGRRLLRLVRGQARFAVAHDGRPFTVLAGGGSVTARGTVFAVALTPGARVDVVLFEGAVDVALPRPGPDDRPPVVRRLAPGERLTFAARAELPAATPLPAPSSAPAPVAGAARDYAGVTLAALVAEANRTSPRPIRLTDAALGKERISGRFRTDDTALLAQRLAVLFGARADMRNSQEIVLTR